MSVQPTTIDTIEKVHALYQTSFSTFVTVVGVVIAFTGIVLPLLVTAYQVMLQRRETKLAHEKLDSFLEKAVRETEIRLLAEQAKTLEAFAERSETLLRSSQEETDKKVQKAEAGAFHVQATLLSNANHPLGCLSSASDAVPGYVAGKDYLNLRRVVAKLMVPSLENLNAPDFNGHDDLVEKCRECCTTLKAIDENGGFRDLERELQNALNVALQRKPAANTA
jgi:hypothetical protein